MPIAFLALLLCGQQTPPYLPRTGAAVVFVQNGSVSPAMRLGWEVDLVDQPRNTLVAGLQLGGAYSTTVNFWQYVGLLGLGYRMQREIGFHWGFDIGFGPAGFGDQREKKVLPYIEGRVHAGWRVAVVTLALAVGYGQAVSRDPFSVTQRYLGGWFVGLLVGWK
ncbi:MAG: hypothetical protein JNK82_07175 [Myxococcaceae bacterium]|nr:hypothetical protein [Myxococcaceae bacterium]